MTRRETDDELRQYASSLENRCFACGPGNPNGLHLHFERDGDAVRAELVVQSWQQGWTGVLHGGILTTMLDEAMAYALFYGGHQGVTARLEVRFRVPARSGDRLAVVGRIVREARRIADIEARVCRDDEVIAESSGRFVKLGPLSKEVLLG
jgi:uncharacterized protein (TIGR00369 family)